MEIEGLVKQFLNDQVPPQILSMPLPVEVAAAVVERLHELLHPLHPIRLPAARMHLRVNEPGPHRIHPATN